MKSTSRRLLAGVLIPLALGGALAGCGDDSGSATGAKTEATPHDMAGMNHTPGPDEATAATSPGDEAKVPGSEGEQVDQAFVRQMVPHHLAAVLMSTIAADRAKRDKLKRFAARIIEDQTKELATLQRLGTPLGITAGTSSTDDKMADDMKTLGTSMESMAGSSDMLDGQAPFKGVKDAAFDRAYVDEMIKHHEGAVAMAKAEQERGSNGELKALAKEIERAQQDELATLRTWQRHW